MSMLLSREVLLEPYYEIHINGKKLSDDLKKYIERVEVEESDSEADLGRITVADINYVFSNDTSLAEKAPIKIYMGHRKQFRLMLDGEVTHIEADYGEDGIPRLTIGAIDKTNKMTTKKKSRKFKNMTISDIVKRIAKEYGFKPKVTETKPILEEVTQEDETDAQFLVKLADEEAFKVYIVTDTNELYFGSQITGYKASDTVHYNSGDSTLISFRPTLVEKNKSENVSSKNSKISDKTGKTSTSTSTASTASKSPSKTSKASNSGKVGISVTTGKVTKR